MNRNVNHPKESLRFFAERGHRQIVVTNGGSADVNAWLDAVDALEAEGLQRVIGVLYTPAFGFMGRIFPS